MKTKYEEFEVPVPNIDGTAVAERVKVRIPLRWDEELREWLLTPEAHQIIEDTKARHMGLLLPEQLRELRQRYGYTQKIMGQLFQVGEKSWTRWESGKHRPSRAINLLIRAVYDNKISINYLLKRAGLPLRPVMVAESEHLSHWLAPALLSNPFATNYIVEGGQVLHIHAKSHTKSAFLKSTSTLWSQQPILSGTQIKSRESSLESLPDHPCHRFDYEKINLA